ncbi:ATP synthase subunit C [Anaerosphaera multitolerans]|uniref:ATPase n=1 Tax=Anaerosphaera multitolerans TaxID=2487351 RepID=A0A437SA47_9FIRM|nr:ATP synthase subunit C [Anaerosphaera multitolerans]RVU55678.1 ATPase [Anaerosphaera multitolerans]
MEKILIVATIIILSTIGVGIYYNYAAKEGSSKKLKRFIKFNLLAFIPTLALALIVVIPHSVSAASATPTSSSGLGFLGAALSTGLAALGTGIAVGNVGSSAIGAVSEDPSLFGKTLIFIGLAEGIAIYGLIISILILGRL